MLHRLIFILFTLLLLVANREFGVADNGDMLRYMQPYSHGPAYIPLHPSSGTSEWQQRYFTQPITYWAAKPAFEAQSWFSSASLFWRTGTFINSLFYSKNVINIHYIGLPFYLAHIAAVGFLLFCFQKTSFSAAWVKGVFVAFIFSDAAVTAYYNSFFAESVMYLALTTIFSSLYCYFYLEKKRSKFIAIMVCIFMSILMVLAKKQYAYAIMYLPFFILIYVHDHKYSIRAHILGAVFGISLGLCVLGGYLYKATQTDEMEYSRVSVYNCLFQGVLKFSNDPELLLRKLDMPAEYAEVIGLVPWSGKGQEFYMVEAKNLSLRQFACSIVHEPGAFGRLLLANMKEMGSRSQLGMVPGSELRESPPPWLFLPSFICSALAGGYLWMMVGGAFFLTMYSCRKCITSPPAMLAILLLYTIIADVTLSTMDGTQEAQKHVLAASYASVLMLANFILLLLINKKTFFYHGKNNAQLHSHIN